MTTKRKTPTKAQANGTANGSKPANSKASLPQTPTAAANGKTTAAQFKESVESSKAKTPAVVSNGTPTPNQTTENGGMEPKAEAKPTAVDSLRHRLEKIQNLDGKMKAIERLEEEEKRLSKFQTHASESLQLSIVDSEGQEFKTGNSTFIRLSIDHDVEQLRKKRMEFEQEILEAHL